MEPPRVPPSDQIRFRARLWTRWSDEDNQGVLNNAVYLSLLEEARYRYFDGLGLIESCNAFSFLLGQTDLRFLAPGRGPAEVEVELVTTRIGRKSFGQAYRIRPADGGPPWVEAEAAMVMWDGAAQETIPIPPAFRAAVADFEGLAADDPVAGS
ncbi:MAG: thioesterase family protein [Planctomycetes bacterium]|nr:thioesterase family protein [Planctomycetota bacterium]MBL7009073.1 thioesterase family protein [Planctomycetota bacterium]